MSTYQYKAIDESGKAIEGEFSGKTRDELEKYFVSNALRPLRVLEKRPGLDLSKEWKKISTKRLRDVDLIAFTRQFSAAYGAGLSIPQTLDILRAQVTHKGFQEALVNISTEIRAGKTLTEAFKPHPNYFDDHYIAILRIGELSGNLDEVLNYAASMLEKRLSHKERLKATFLYPKIVLGVIGITIGVILVFVIPQFVTFYSKFDAALPLPTQILVNSSTLVVRYGWYGLGAFFIFLPFIKKILRKPSVQYWIDRRFLKLPILGPTFLKIDLTQFCVTFSLLLRAGVRVTEAVEVAIESMSNAYLKKEMRVIIPTLERGGTFVEAMEILPFIPKLLVSMLGIGEQAGALENLLEKIAALYDNETEMTLKKLPTLLEPLILSFLFGLVLLVALAVYLPMWRMSSVVLK